MVQDREFEFEARVGIKIWGSGVAGTEIDLLWTESVCLIWVSSGVPAGGRACLAGMTYACLLLSAETKKPWT